MSRRDSVELFDHWAGDYDHSVRSATGFPFAGYEQVLNEIARLAHTTPGMTILDLGTGTGNLAARFVHLGCTVWGIDFSAEMLAKARVKVPEAEFVEADLLSEWPHEVQRRFDRIVSAYSLHEFDLGTKVKLLRELSHRYLQANGRIVVGDIAFSTTEARDGAHGQWPDLWDEDEHYWIADETVEASRLARFWAKYTQVSPVGGVFVFEPISLEKGGT